jgi:hypothetical protein
VRERDAEHFEKVAGRLHALEFPVLIRPAVPYGAPPTAELIAWAVEVYVFCFLAHIRQLMESYALLVRHMHWPTTFFVGRGLFELAGHATLVLQKVRDALKTNDYAVAWEVLDAANMGNRHMRERNVKTADDVEWPAPFRVRKGVRALNATFPEDARAADEAEVMYSHLSEFCHPNMGAFSQYCEFEQRGETSLVRMRRSPEDVGAISEARIAVTLGLLAAVELLSIYGRHADLAARVQAAWDEFNDTSRGEN